MGKFQSGHPLVEAKANATLEDWVLHLVHQKAYESAYEYSRGRSVLDWGCNDGYGLTILSGAATHLTGVDCSERAIRAAHGRPLLHRADLVCCCGTVLPFDISRRFDVVTLFQVIEHIEDAASLLNEVSHRLTPGGVALISTPNARLRLDPGMRPWNVYHVREYSDQEFLSLLTPHFTSVELVGLFGTAEIEAIERSRIAVIRRRARAVHAAERLALAHIERELPEWPVERISIQMGRRPQSIMHARASDPGFSTENLRYEPQSADALDLLAICRSR
jgi:2-polyprenyl-3-methyl-5-hydroxy-6-metoxy-1,4-benzoquinol methylase